MSDTQQSWATLSPNFVAQQRRLSDIASCPTFDESSKLLDRNHLYSSAISRSVVVCVTGSDVCLAIVFRSKTDSCLSNKVARQSCSTLLRVWHGPNLTHAAKRDVNSIENDQVSDAGHVQIVELWLLQHWTVVKPRCNCILRKLAIIVVAVLKCI